MAWQSTGKNHADLIRNLCVSGIIKSSTVKNAMLQVDRKFFCPHSLFAYEDRPQSIGFGATISAPHMHAHALEILHDKLIPGARVLDVGSGTGYLTACFWTMVGSGGKVIGIDHVDQLVAQSIKNVSDWKKTAIESQNFKLIVGDGRKGCPQESPFDVINVGAGAEEIPKALIEQLAPGGRLLIPVGEEYTYQSLIKIDKDLNGNLTRHSMGDVVFVPLTDRHKQTDEEFS